MEKGWIRGDRIDKNEIDYKVTAVTQVKENTEEMGKKDEWMDYKYMYRWNEQDLVVDYALKMMNKKE